MACANPVGSHSPMLARAIPVGSCQSFWIAPILFSFVRTNPVRSHQSCWLMPALLARTNPVGPHQSCWLAPILLAHANPVGLCQPCWLMLARSNLIQFSWTTHNSVARSLIAHCRCLGVALAQLIKHVLLCIANMFPPGDTDNHLVHA